MATILLSIRPEYAEAILEGRKRYEFRKSRSKDDVRRIIFYASSPRRRVVGAAAVEEILEGSPEDVWKITGAAAGITKEYYLSYYAGKDRAVAYKLKNIVRYDAPKELSDYGICRAPQSFVYLDR